MAQQRAFGTIAGITTQKNGFVTVYEIHTCSDHLHKKVKKANSQDMERRAYRPHYYLYNLFRTLACSLRASFPDLIIPYLAAP
jgi:hypothetical protein